MALLVVPAYGEQADDQAWEMSKETKQEWWVQKTNEQ
jgi:hypothetical protein